MSDPVLRHIVPPGDSTCLKASLTVTRRRVAEEERKARCPENHSVRYVHEQLAALYRKRLEIAAQQPHLSKGQPAGGQSLPVHLPKTDVFVSQAARSSSTA
jgi:hypothetical protein